jgi:membrane protease YdiL (CAAX protease family)
MLTDAFGSVLWSIASLILLLGGIGIYITVIRQVVARRSTVELGSGNVIAPKAFDWPEAVLGAAIISYLILNTVASLSHSPVELNSRDLIANLLFIVIVVLFIAAFLKVRGLDINSLGGFSKISFLRAASTGLVLLVAAYPLIIVADGVVQRLFGGGSSKQGIVDLFSGSQTLRQRILIIILAVAIAPMSEEFIFRFFLYGVLRRYLGAAAGLILNALLFALVHAHLPSFAPLFVLGSCFTLAYEWSGSILVSMTMHSLFNSTTLLLLAFPQLFQQ